MKLPTSERLELVEQIMHSLDRQDPELDRIWIEEAERRLAAYRSGRVKGIPARDVVGDFIAVAHLHRAPRYWVDRNKT